MQAHKPFLQEVADHLVANHINEIEQLALVFPNKRTGTYFKKYFAAAVGKTVWSPNVFTVGSLVKMLTGMHTTDSLGLLFELHAVYNQCSGKEPETFDRFYSFGEILLRDFNELDSYLIDAESLFTNLHDLSAIDDVFEYMTDEQRELVQRFWASILSNKEGQTERSPQKKNFEALWGLMPLVYKKFGQYLLDKNMAYEGLVYRQLAQMIDTDNVSIAPFKQLVFIGFNAVNTAQLRLFDFLQERDQVRFYWDFDHYYLDNPFQEAGKLLRQYTKRYAKSSVLLQAYNNLNDPKKEVELISVPLEISQAKILPQLFSKHIEAGLKTAIVVTDEKFLFPVLHSLPPEVAKVNVTMGYPLNQTPLHQLLEACSDLQLNMAVQPSNSNKRFFHKDVSLLLKNPMVQGAEYALHLKVADRPTEKILRKIKEQQLAYVKQAEILATNSELLSLIFTQVEEDKGQLLLRKFMNILFLLFDKDKKQGEIEKEYIYQAYTQLKRLLELLDLHAVEASIKVTVRLLRQLLNQSKVPFIGDPIDGLQVMGILETRNLDFEQVILLGANEGIFPPATRPVTFIPESLRVAFGLNTMDYQDSIFAYLFYRLLQRAKRMGVLYNSITGYNGSGELTRYIMQLKYESALNIKQKHLGHNLMPTTPLPIRVHKNDAVMASLNKYLDTDKPKSFSASALNTYIDCSLRFYFRYVADLKKPMEVTETIQPNTFGSIFHYVIEKLYANHCQQKGKDLIEPSDFKTLADNVVIENLIFEAFNAEEHLMLDKGDKADGSRLLAIEVIKRYVANILQVDRAFAPFQVVALEKKNGYRTKIGFHLSNGNRAMVNLAGTIDRIDLKQGVLRIVDYKTGNINNKVSDIESLTNRELSSRNKTAFQMFFYSYLFNGNNPERKRFKPAVYCLRGMGSGQEYDASLYIKEDKKTVPIDESITPELLNSYEETLGNVLTDIFNPELEFEQTQKAITCAYCDYKDLCSK